MVSTERYSGHLDRKEGLPMVTFFLLPMMLIGVIVGFFGPEPFRNLEGLWTLLRSWFTP